MKRKSAAILICGIFVFFPMVEVQSSDGDLSWPAKVEVWRHGRLQSTREENPEALLPFTTDGCSGGMSSAWAALARNFPGFARVFEHQAPWHDCCVSHDEAYHLGGVDPQAEVGYFARLEADQALRQCVRDVAGAQAADLAVQYESTEEDVTQMIHFVADRMFDAVRVGGLPCSGLPWRWGYGWPQCF